MQILVRVLCGILALAIAALALTVTVSFYSTYGNSGSTQSTFIALAFISAAIKLLAPAAAHLASKFRPVQVCLWLGFVAAVVFDSFGVAGYVEMTYGATTGEASRYADDYKEAGKEVSRLEGLYNEYAAQRPTAEVAAAVDSAKLSAKAANDVAGKCTPRRAHLDACVAASAADQEVGKLEQELARADERDKRERKWNEAKLKFDSMKKPSVTADPQAAVIARLGRRLGLDGLADFVAPIISVLIFIFFEVVGPALAYVALHGQGSVAPTAPKNAPAPRASAAGSRRRAAGAPQTADGVLAALRGLIAGGGADGVAIEGGQLVSNQRALGKAVGISGAKMNRHLGELEAAGSIAKRTGPNGTVISIL